MTHQVQLNFPSLPAQDLLLLEEGRHPDPFSVLGRHVVDGVQIVRAFLPGAPYVEITSGAGEERRTIAMTGNGSGLFEAPFPHDELYRLRVAWPIGLSEHADPYSFGLLLSEEDIYLFAEGRHFDLS